MEQTENITFEGANAMLAGTWGFLRINDVDVEVPEGLAITRDVQVEADAAALGAPDAFDAAIDAAQAAWEAEHPALTAEELAEREAVLKTEADATYGGTAQSAYQIGADALEEARSLRMAFETGMGEDANAWLRYVAGDPVVIAAAEGASVQAAVRVNGVPGAANVAAVDVVAAAGSSIDLVLTVDGAADDNAAQGVAGTALRVFAGEGATVSIVRTQTLDDAFVDFDDLGLFADATARVDVRQTVLGAGRAYTGLAGDLRGVSAQAGVVTRYLGRGNQRRDFNYILRHHGPKTQCNLNANGVLAGSCEKTLRGTIDLIRGAKGAEGQETETVLLVDDGVRNKTVPVILCNEDDVAGNHGATIGHVRPEQMFYLASRGLSQEAAEQMFVGAIMEQAALDAPDEASRAGVLRLGEHVAPGFAALFED